MTGPPEMAPFASIIVPARDAEKTLDEALDSVRAQTSPEWECVIIDDGSADQTLEIARTAASNDPRFRVLSQANAGVGAARNAGLAIARGTWIMLLDADDQLEADALLVLGGRVRADPTLDAAYGQWVRMSHDGVLLDQGPFWSDSDSLFPALAHRCVLVIHTVLFRRDLLKEVGLFDTTLTTCEDWDFWQRVARSGAHFAAVPQLVARYRLRPDSASLDAVQLLIDGIRVIDQGHKPDPRVRHSPISYAAGQPRQEVAAHEVRLACWCAGREIGSGRDAAQLVDLLDDDRAEDVDAFDAGISLFDELLVVSADAELAHGAAGKLNPSIERFLQAVEDHLRSPGWRHRAQRAIERRALEKSCRRPTLVGRGHGVEIELTAPVPDIEAPTGAEHLRCDLLVEGDRLATIELPVCDGVVPAAVLGDAAAAATFWPLLGRFFACSLYPGMLVRRAEGWALRRGGLDLVTGLGGDRQAAMLAAHEQVGWTVMLQELWSRPEWSDERFHLAGSSPDGARFIALQDGWCVVEITSPTGDVMARDACVPAVLEVGGAPVCWSLVPASNGSPIVTGGQLRAALTLTAGIELARVAAREAIIGQPLDAASSLAERLAGAAGKRTAGPVRPIDGPTLVSSTPSWSRIITAIRDKQRPTLVLAARDLTARCGTSASRRAVLPASAAATLLAAAEGAHELALPVPSDVPPARVEYVPELIWRPVQSAEGRVSEGRASAGSPRARSAVRTARRRLGRWRRRSSTPEVATDRLPILMYHQVTTGGPKNLARYRLSPAALEAQLSYLDTEGVTGVTLDAWQVALSTRQAMPGRCVCITFDDGFTDFLTDAWPLLRRFGFPATMFIVTDRVGQDSSWDARLGTPAPLLDWDQIGQLESEGVRFGSHTATHAHLTGLAPSAAVDELGRSRAALHEHLDHPLDALAYPYGDVDGIAAHLAGACGFTSGLTCRPGLSGLTDDLLLLPRVEVGGALDMAGFAAALTGA